MCIIRFGTLEDIPTIIKISQESEIVVYDVSIYEMLVGSTIVCVCGDQVVGYIMLANLIEHNPHPKLIEHTFLMKGNNYIKVIMSIAVTKSYRNIGIGDALLQHAHNYLLASKQYNSLILQVRVSNPAKNLYERFGFKTIYTAEKYYSDPNAKGGIEDAFVQFFNVKSRMSRRTNLKCAKEFE